jgi:uncharacterized protein (TIGR03492 family)
MLRGAFGAVARAADVALGTSGTANEQLAGLGIPVVAFATGGPQYTAGFAHRQGRLLGEALRVLSSDPQALARGIQEVLEDGAARARAAVTGLDRIGPAGALPVITAEIRRQTGSGHPRTH